MENLLNKLEKVYGEDSQFLLDEIKNIIRENRVFFENRKTDKLSQKDVFLIAYPDHIRRKGDKPLSVLSEFANRYLRDVFNYIHILPHYPYSSDDGFSVIDFYEVNPECGDWKDVKSLEFKLVFDAVINHISSKSEWFREALAGDEKYRDYFLWMEETEEINLVTRPRTHPLLTPFETDRGVEKVWTTFSDDQIDLNYSTPQLFLEILRILVFYMKMGAEVFRLDAIAYLWKELGTTCIHHEFTHEIIKIWRIILTEINPQLLLLTETNVPHEENISYFGNGEDEAHIVYQFSLPPLVVHTIQTGNSEKIKLWAEKIEKINDSCTYFNFTASHDGIGVRPARGLLSNSEIEEMIEKVKDNSGKISEFKLPDGSTSPYEMNITYFDAVFSKEIKDEETIIDRFVASQAIVLSFIGVPAIYLPSLFGLRNYLEGVEQTGMNRTINREKYNYEKLESLMSHENIHSRIFKKIERLVRIRKTELAFSPFAEQEILKSPHNIFSFKRRDMESGDELIVIINISNEKSQFHREILDYEKYADIINGRRLKDKTHIDPYEVLWLKEF